MTIQFRPPAGLTAAQEATARQNFDAVQRLIDTEGWAITTVAFPLAPGAPESSRLYVHYTVGMTPLGRHELCLQSRTVPAGQRMLALLTRAMLTQGHSVPLDDGDLLRVESLEPMRVRHHRNLTPFTQVVQRYTFPRMVELMAPGAP